MKTQTFNIVASINNSEALSIAKSAQTAKPTYKAAKIQEITEADSVLVEKLSRQKRNVFLQVIHTARNSATEAVAETATKKRGRKPLEVGFGNAEVFICCAIESKTKYIVLSRIAVLSCFDYEAENLTLKSDLLQEAISAYSNQENNTERKRAAYNPFTDVEKVDDIVVTVRQHEEIVQQRIDTKEVRMQKRAERQKMLAERAKRRENRAIRKQIKNLKARLVEKYAVEFEQMRQAKKDAQKAKRKAAKQAQTAVSVAVAA